MTDRYTKIVLTIIAAALVWLAVLQTIPSAEASRHEPMAVFIAEISDSAAECLAGHITWVRGDTGPCIVSWD